MNLVGPNLYFKKIVIFLIGKLNYGKIKLNYNIDDIVIAIAFM